MATVKVNTSDLDWIKRHASEDDVIPYGTDTRGVMYFQADVTVLNVEHVTFAGAKMIRFEFVADAPLDHGRTAMYPDSYLVAE